MNNLAYRDQGKQVWQIPLYIPLGKPLQPHEYERMLDFFTGIEKFGYIQLTTQHASGRISDYEFNKQHKAFFKKAIGRWNSIYIFMQLKLGNLWRYMDGHELEEFYQGVIWIRNDLSLRPHGNKYISDLKQQLLVKKHNMEESAKFAKTVSDSHDDEIVMKLSGGRHSDFESKNYTMGEGGISYV